MKKTIFMLTAAIMLAACEKLEIPSDEEAEKGGEQTEVTGTRKFTFTVKGDFSSPTFSDGEQTRAGYLQADEKDMTDLWVFDYMGSGCVQTLHQTADDDTWGKPTLTLAYGSHHVYFVASRGDNPALDAEGHVITWGIPRDTFWKDYQMDVVSTSNGNRAVTLDRVATRLRLLVKDEVPAGCASVTISPEKWLYGWDYVAGVAMASQHSERVISVPSSYIGTAGTLSLSIYGFSDGEEWATDVSVLAKDVDGNVLGRVTIENAPFKPNRSTEYSGNLFRSSGAVNLVLNDTWSDAITGDW